MDVQFHGKAGAPAVISLLEYVRRRRGGMFVILDNVGRPPGSRAVAEYDRNTGGGAVLGFMPPRTPQHNQMGVLWREIKRAIADIYFDGIGRMQTAMIRMPAAERRPSPACSGTCWRPWTAATLYRGPAPRRHAPAFRVVAASVTRPRTTSTDCSVRILLWFISFILYNVWILARFMAARGGGYHPGARPPVTLNLFVSMLLDAANMQPAGNPGGHPPD